MRLAAACLAATVAIAPSPAAAQRHAIDVPAGTLGDALRLLARQTGISVGGTEPGMAAIATPAVKGRMSAEAALARLLANTPYRAVRVRTAVFRIERRPARAARRTEAPPRQAPAPAVVEPIEIVVTASRRGLPVAEYPGSATVIELDPADPANRGVEGLGRLLADQPLAASTELGPGRNKRFLRGIADSSFNGPTQATIGLYLGELRLIYSAPDPDLRLYDVNRVELLEGPQGTLYGAGTLGGVIRIEPNAPDPRRWGGRVWASGELREHGAPAGGFAAMINAPLGKGVAVRALGYGEVAGGYVADRQRRLRDINRSETWGGRVAARADLGGGWRADLLGVAQRIDTRDGQYIDARVPGLARRAAIGQPFANLFAGSNLTLSGTIGGVRLVSSTGFIGNDLDSRYDSSVLVGPRRRQAFDEQRRIRMMLHETRLASTGAGPFSWVAGLSLLRNRDRYSQIVRSLDGDSPPPFANIRYTVTEAALFGEGSTRLGGGWSLTAGGRLILSYSGSLRRFGTNVASEDQDSPLRFLPVLALSWAPRDGTLFWLRGQKSYRTGGVSVERATNGDPIPARFDADSLDSVEAGMRLLAARPMRLEIAATAFHTRWHDVQADLIQAQGFPITRNIGDGSITGLTASAQVAPAAGLNLGGALFVNRSRIDRLAPDATITRHTLPNVAGFGANGWIAGEHSLAGGMVLSARAEARYVGRSYLDLDPTSQVAQGDYWDVGVTLGARRGRWAAAIEGRNLLGVRGNRFAFGDPFTAHIERQATPLVPRRIRLSLTLGF